MYSFSYFLNAISLEISFKYLGGSEMRTGKIDYTVIIPCNIRYVKIPSLEIHSLVPSLIS